MEARICPETPPFLYAIHGYIASGKTTFGQYLEDLGRGVLLSQDQWMTALYGNNPPAQEFGKLYNLVENLILSHAGKLLDHGISVIFDNGFWSSSSREAIRSFAKKHKAEICFYELIASDEEMLERLRQRNHSVKSQCCFMIDDSAFNSLRDRFEPLTVSEARIPVCTIR